MIRLELPELGIVIEGEDSIQEYIESNKDDLNINSEEDSE